MVDRQLGCRVAIICHVKGLMINQLISLKARFNIHQTYSKITQGFILSEFFCFFVIVVRDHVESVGLAFSCPFPLQTMVT